VEQVLEIGLAADQTASAVATFPGAVVAIEMLLAEARVVITDPVLGQVAAEVHQVWALVAAEEAAVAVASVAAAAVVDAGKGREVRGQENTQEQQNEVIDEERIPLVSIAGRGACRMLMPVDDFHCPTGVGEEYGNHSRSACRIAGL